MARSLSSNVLNALELNTNVKYFYLINVDLDDTTTYRVTSFNRDLTYNGNVYGSDGGLFQIDTPNFSSIVDREAYKIVFADTDETIQNKFKNGKIIGRDIEVYIGICDSNGDPLLSTDSNGISDVSYVYSGFVDTPEISIDWISKTAAIEGTSPMADLDQVKTITVSKDGMDQFSTTDKSYDLLFEDSESIVKWGKI